MTYQQKRLQAIYNDPVRHAALKAEMRRRDLKRRGTENRRVSHNAATKRYNKLKHVREARAVICNRRRARKAQAGGDYTLEEFKALGNQCLCCGHSDIPMTADHIVPLSRGGTNDISNIQPLCLICNDIKHAKTVDYRWPTQGYYGA